MSISPDKTEAKLRAILESAVEGIVTIDDRGIVESANAAVFRLFGYEEEELVGNDVGLLMPSPYREEHQQFIDAYLETGEAKVIGIGREVTGRHKDGTLLPLYLSVTEIWVEGERYFTGIVRDVREQKRAEMRETEFGKILDDSLNEIYIFDAESLKFVCVNRGARENIGYSMRELCQLTPLDLKPNYTPDTFEELLRPLRSGEVDRVKFDSVHRRKDGSQYNVEVHLQLSAYRLKPAFVAVILDITDRKAAEDRLLHSERLAAIGQVVTGIAHESRNALQRILSKVEILQMDLDDHPNAQEDLAKIEQAASDIQRLLDEVRNYAAPLNLDISPCQIDRLWRNAWAQLESVRGTRNAALLELPSDCRLEIQADAFRLEQTFRNLFENSLAACADPVRIEVACEEVQIPGGPALRITVHDNGPGLNAEQSTKVFDAFYTTKQKGTGLGMAIARRVMEAHGGSIAAGSPARGAEFILTLPRQHRPDR